MRKTESQRFWEKVSILPNGCWPWTGCTSGPYGHFGLTVTIPGAHAKMIGAHVWSYTHCVGPIPEGLQLDHSCRNKLCVNPLHLYPVTGQVNTLIGIGPAAINAAKSVCKWGHNNWQYRTDGTGRACATCLDIRARAYQLRKKDQNR